MNRITEAQDSDYTSNLPPTKYLENVIKPRLILFDLSLSTLVPTEQRTAHLSATLHYPCLM